MTADRRQITLLSCDMVDSTLYASSQDPEDLELLMTGYFETCKQVVEDSRGTLAHHTGDGFLAYFGFPRTLGRNAQEAIECGLALSEAMSEINVSGGGQVQVRIGIATGLVVLNDIHRLNNSSETFAVGSSIHLAARIQSTAETGKVLVDETTQQLASQNFEFIDKGIHQLKGFAQPNRLWQVGATKRVQSSFGERIEAQTPFVGRSQELQTLTSCWRKAQHGEGQVVLITGEPGIGKSRIVYEFVERVAPKNQPLVYQCLEDRENAPLHPWINQLRHTAQLLPREPLAHQHRKAAKVFDASFPGNERLRSFVLSMVSKGSSLPAAPDETDPEFKLDLLREAHVKRVFELGADEVQIVIVEDIHWIDPSSEAVWNSLVTEAAKHRVLLLATCHADRASEHVSPQLTHVRLDKLDAQQSIALASQIINAAQIQGTLISDIVDRSDGVPLFVAELARNLSETGFVPIESSSAPIEPKQSKEMLQLIPDTLQGTLLARLDRLGRSKRLAQIASVVGRQFGAEVLELLTKEVPAALAADLSVLVESGLIVERTSATAVSYEFKHGLIRDTAYNSLLRRDAVRLHSELVTIYEAHFPRLRSAEPEVLARHLTIAGRGLDAASVWLEAGEAAKDMGSTEEALRRLESCLQSLQSCDDNHAARCVRMRCEMLRGATINFHHGPVEQSAHDAFAEAAKLAEDVGDAEFCFEALIRLAMMKYNAADFSGARSIGEKANDFGKAHGNRRASTDGRVLLGLCAFAVGNFKSAQDLLNDALELMQGDEDDVDTYTGLALGYQSLTEYILGDEDKAERLCWAGIERARSCGASEVASALGNSLYMHSMRKDIEMTRSICGELVPISERMGYKMWFHHAQFFLGWALTSEGERGGFEMMEESMQRFRRAHEMVEQTLFYYLLAERYLADGNCNRARHNVDLGLALVKQLGERFFEVPLLRLKALCCEAGDQPAEADEVATLNTLADKTAREQGATIWY